MWYERCFRMDEVRISVCFQRLNTLLLLFAELLQDRSHASQVEIASICAHLVRPSRHVCIHFENIEDMTYSSHSFPTEDHEIVLAWVQNGVLAVK